MELLGVTFQAVTDIGLEQKRALLNKEIIQKEASHLLS